MPKGHIRNHLLEIVSADGNILFPMTQDMFIQLLSETTFTCSKSTMKTAEQDVESVQI